MHFHDDDTRRRDVRLYLYTVKYILYVHKVRKTVQIVGEFHLRGLRYILGGHRGSGEISE